ncbi:MAG: SLC13/DASS family transporter [Pirellulales bacterium]|nr:SLC13/DASS family transporter [Pirellulales bacterium]
MDADEFAGPSWISRLGLFAGPGLALALWAAPHVGETGARWVIDSSRPELNSMAAVMALMAIWWLSEAIPSAATGLVPLALFPALGILSPVDTAACYGNTLLFLFLGGFFIALALEQSGLHRRVALTIISAAGDSPRQLVLGFMLATAALSMWISNTATTMMMLPIATSLLGHAAQQGGDPVRQHRFASALLLGVAYAASIGGFATLIGTPTNLAFKELYNSLFDGRAPEITFGGWMLLATPLSFAILICAWILLVRVSFRLSNEPFWGSHDTIAEARRQLGPMRPAEWQMAVIFSATSLLWIFREPVAGWGWAALLGLDSQSGAKFAVDDTTVAMSMALLCFLLPGHGLRGRPLLNWQIASRTPWGILLLFGGGLALAEGLQSTGLDQLLGERFGAGLKGASPLMVVFSVAAGMTLLTELTGNITCVNMSMPILAPLAVTIGCDPRLLMIPAAIAASFGFMLPVGTPPNAIAYSTGKIDGREMARAGFLIDAASVVLLVLFLYGLGMPAMGLEWNGLPDWAKPPETSSTPVPAP